MRESNSGKQISELRSGHRLTGQNSKINVRIADDTPATTSTSGRIRNRLLGTMVGRSLWARVEDGRHWHHFPSISDLHGQVQHLSQIARRLIELDKLDYPAGPRMSGHYENHLNWDMVIVLRYAWPSLDEPTRARVRDEIQRMLGLVSVAVVRADGSFKTSEIDEL